LAFPTAAEKLIALIQAVAALMFPKGLIKDSNRLNMPRALLMRLLPITFLGLRILRGSTSLLKDLSFFVLSFPKMFAAFLVK